MDSQDHQAKLLSKLRKTNNYLTWVAILFAVYLITSPFLPMVSFAYKKLIPEDNSLISKSSPEIYETNQLIIPDIGVNENIVESNSINNIHEKVWHRPGTGNPSDGNMVLVAHRYANIGGNRSSTFYNLPNIEKGNVIIVWWMGEEYKYEVSETFEVTPDQVEIESPSETPMLTLYTCTPLWNSTHRFVVRAIPI